MDGELPQSNPYGMDEDCTNCDELAACRTQVVHGYGDVGAEFLVIGDCPSPGADETGTPFTGAQDEPLRRALHDIGFARTPPDVTPPDLQNVFLTYLTRCRHPDRQPTDAEITNCEPFLNAEVRTINPQIIVPIGTRVLRALATEYTTRDPESFDATATHATTIRGRGFELVPMKPLPEQTPADTDQFVTHLTDNVLSRDYRQTKGRRER